MTFHIPRHVQTMGQTDAVAPPAPLTVTASEITSLDFGLIDLITGHELALTVHRVPGPLPERQSRLQYRIDSGAAVDLPQPVSAGTTVIGGLARDVAVEVSLRLVSIDPLTGLDAPGDWSPAATATPTGLDVANRLSDTADPVANTAGRWDGATLWAGATDGEGFAAFTSPTARQSVPPLARPAAATTMLAIATLRTDGASETRLRVSGTPAAGTPFDVAAAMTWATGTASLVDASGAETVSVTRVSYDAGTGRARIAVVFTLPDGAADGLDFAVEGAQSAFQGADLRSWTSGDTSWPEPELVSGDTLVAQLTPPSVIGFGSATLEADPAAPWSLPFTVFGGENAVAGQVSARTNALTGASVAAAGSGYADGEHDLPVAGGEAGVVRISVVGGALVGASVLNPGRKYLAEPTVDPSAIPGGSGGSVDVTRATVLRGFWPRVNDGVTRASWGDGVLGVNGFEVKGVVADGAYVYRNNPAPFGDGASITVYGDGSWLIEGGGAPNGRPEDEGAQTTVGLVVGNGGTRAVMDMVIGVAGDGPRRMKVVGLPAVYGTGCIGDTLVAMPGRAIDGVAPEAGYEWLLDGVRIFGENGPRLVLDIARFSPGQVIELRVAWRDQGLNEEFTAPAVTVRDFKVIEDGGIARIGARTPPGLGGLPVGRFGLSITTGNEDGAFQTFNANGVTMLGLAAGPVTPDSNPATSGEAATPGTRVIGLTDGSTVTVTVVDGEYSVRSGAELAALAQTLASPAGQGQYGFDLGSGGTIRLWPSAEYGHVDDPAEPGSRLDDLVLVGGDADGGASKLVVAPYDTVDGAVVTGPVGLVEARNLSWQVDLVHAPAPDDTGSSFAGGLMVRIDALGRSVAFEDLSVRGAMYLRERVSAADGPTGMLLGGSVGVGSGGGTPALTLRRAAVADIGTVCDLAFGAVTVEDCRIERCGPTPLRFGASAASAVGAVTVARSVMSDATGAGPFNPGAWITVQPDGAGGYDPVYRPGLSLTVEDCVMLPGQEGLAAMDGIVLARDAALGDGSAEADFGFVHAPVTLRRVLALGGLDRGLALSSGEAGAIEDCAFLADSRSRGTVALGLATGTQAVTHANIFRPLGAGFALTRMAANAIAMDAASATDTATVSTDGYAAAYGGEDARAFAPRTLAEAMAAFRPRAGGALDLGPGAADCVGPITKTGLFKGSLSAVPAVQPVAWGVASWGSDGLVTGVGWGSMPTQPSDAFAILATRVSGTAPLGVHVEMGGLSNEERLLDEVEWDFGDYYEFDALPEESQAVRIAGRGRGWAYGHVFREPGSYTVTGTHRTRAGGERTATLTIEVQDPDLVYPGTTTICVSSAGDFTDAPAGARLETDIDTAIALVEGTVSPRRLLLRAGETFVLGAKGIALRSRQIVGRFGPGPRPIYRADTASTSFYSVLLQSNSTETSVADLVIQDTYDAAAPIDPSLHPNRGAARSNFFANGTTSRCTMVNVDITGGGILFAVPIISVTANCSFRNWSNYGALTELRRGALVGCTVAQVEDAVDASGFKTTNDGMTLNDADHGPVRVGNTEAGVVAQSHIESYNGWTRTTDVDGNDVSAHQPCIRLQSTTSPRPSHGGLVSGTHMRGGASMLSITPGAQPSSALGLSRGWLILDNYFEGNSQNSKILETFYPWVAIRNNVVVHPDIPPILRRSLTFFDPNSFRAGDEGKAMPIWVDHNTIALDSQRPGGDYTHVGTFSNEFTDIREADNAISVLGFDNGATFGDPGPMENNAPLPGSPLIAASTALSPVSDRRGVRRPALASSGALEPFVPQAMDFGAGAGAALIDLGTALGASGRMTVALRLARMGSGSRFALALPGGRGIQLLSPSDLLRLALAYDDGSTLVDTTLDGIALQGAQVSIMLAVDLAGGMTGGRTVSLWVDGTERYASTLAARPTLADPSGTQVLAGTAAATLSQWFWADTGVALDPAVHWGAFFDAAGLPRNLEPAGRAGGVRPAVFVNGPAYALASGVNLGTGPGLAVSGTIADI
ncbi:MAG: hypothetical protein AAF677_07955 [Pseudomonadota bacterium]